MRKLILIIMIFFNSSALAQAPIYDIEINDIYSQPIDLSHYQGKYILFVNVASKCGFTSQYKDLEKLHQNYKDKLIVIGLPCNQFGGQEPGNEKEIQNFCSINYGISFLMTEKVEVKGDRQHRLYSWLTDKKLNGKVNSTVKWNFQKYLVGPDGKLIDFFYSITKPLSSKITSVLEQ